MCLGLRKGLVEIRAIFFLDIAVLCERRELASAELGSGEEMIEGVCLVDGGVRGVFDV